MYCKKKNLKNFTQIFIYDKINELNIYLSNITNKIKKNKQHSTMSGLQNYYVTKEEYSVTNDRG